MPIRVVEKNSKDRIKQAKQQSGMAKQQQSNMAQDFKGSKKADEPQSPRERMNEKKAKQREQRIMLKEYGMKKGGLKGNQKKLDKNNNNRIDAQDFKILKAEKAKGRGMGLQDEKVKPGKVMKARKGKLVPLKSDPTKAISSVKPSAGGKGGPPNKTPKEARSAVKDFIARRKKLAGAGRIGAAATLLGIAGAGAAKLGQTIGRKYFGDPTKGEKNKMSMPIKKKNKKMGGGMMKYTKGGGADTGTAGERKSKLMTAVDRFKRRIDPRKRRPKYIKPPERKSMIPAGVGQVAQSLTPTGLGKQMGRKVMGKMGGGMMQKPMGYKAGTMIKARGGGIARSKPTKMY